MPADIEKPIAIGTCESFAEELTASLDGRELAPAAAVRHFESCLRCQADLVQYRRLLRTLRHLRTDYLEPAPGLLTEVFATLEEAGERHAILAVLHGRRAAYIGGIAAAATAAGAGAMVLASRRSRMKLVG